jgi:hypothetical protein
MAGEILLFRDSYLFSSARLLSKDEARRDSRQYGEAAGGR